MNIQQALNQSILSIAGSAYLTGETIDRGRETGTAKLESASDAYLKNDKEYMEKVQPKIDEWKAKGDTQEQIDAALEANPIVVEGQALTKRLQNAEKDLRKWYWTSKETDDLMDLHYAKYGKQTADIFDAWDAAAKKSDKDAKKSIKALASLKNKTKTAANTEQEVKRRREILRLGLNKSMHQPSVRMEE